MRVCLVTGAAEQETAVRSAVELAVALGLDGEVSARLERAVASLCALLLPRVEAVRFQVQPLQPAGLEILASARFAASEALLGELVKRCSGLAARTATEEPVLAAQADELDLDFRTDESVALWARFHDRHSSAASPGHELAVVGRAVPGDSPSGDDAAWSRQGDDWVAVVADGLGHGRSARESSSRAVACVAGAGLADLQEAAAAAGRALLGLRGVTLSQVHWDSARGRLTHLGVGDVSALLVSPGRPGARRFVTAPGILGSQRRLANRAEKLAPGGVTASRIEQVSPEPGDVLVMATDGLRVQLDGERDRALLLGHPAGLAAHLVSTQALVTDDALVMVVRFLAKRGVQL